MVYTIVANGTICQEYHEKSLTLSRALNVYKKY